MCCPCCTKYGPGLVNNKHPEFTQEDAKLFMERLLATVPAEELAKLRKNFIDSQS